MKNIIAVFSFIALTLVTYAGGTFSMVEINPAQGSCTDLFSDSAKAVYGAGELNHFLELNGLLYFVGTDTYHNDELWVTDGTQAGTHKVKEINPHGGAHIGHLRPLGYGMVFMANETTQDTLPTDDYDLYYSDGSDGHTVKIAELNQPVNTLIDPQNAGVTAHGKLVFCTNKEIWVTDGQSNSTTTLKSINSLNYNGSNGYCELNGYIYFVVANDIWRSNGSISGTTIIKSTTTGNHHWPITWVSQMKAFDNKIYLAGSKLGQGEDLFVFDGTDTGTLTKVIDMPTGNTYPTSLEVYAGSLWLVASDTQDRSIYNINVGSTHATKIAPVDIGGLSMANGNIYYLDQTTAGYHVINASTHALSSFGTPSIQPSLLGLGVNNTLIGIGNQVAYLGYDSGSSHQQMLCISDGTTSGIHTALPSSHVSPHPFNYQLGCGIFDIFDLTTYQGMLVIPAHFTNAGRELWFYTDSTFTTGIEPIAQEAGISLYPNPTGHTLHIAIDPAIYTDRWTATIVDIAGQVVMQPMLSSPQTVLSTSELADGSYYLSLTRDGQRVSTHHIAVIH
jgi:ELWxxDGT repeat protein